MTAAAILAETERRGIKLRTDGTLLYFRPKQAVDDELLELLRDNKAAILEHLGRGCARPPAPHRRCPSCGGGLQRGDADGSRCFTCRWPGASGTVQ